jgi:hypothetical protein
VPLQHAAMTKRSSNEDTEAVEPQVDSVQPEVTDEQPTPTPVEIVKVEDTSHAETLAANQAAAQAEQLEKDRAVAAKNEAAVAADLAAQASEVDLSIPAELDITLADYSAMRGLTTFAQGVMVHGARDYNRPFSEWEHARQMLLGG